MGLTFTLLSPPDYIESLTRDIDRATSRIYIAALVVMNDEATHELISSIEAAARRGIEVNIAMDIYFTYREEFVTAKSGFSLKSRLRNMRELKKRLERSGAKIRWLGQFGSFLFSRRTHLKWSIIDSTIYSFGGVNLYSESIHQNSDYFFQVKSKSLADQLASEHLRVIKTDKLGRGYRSHLFGTPEHRVLVDGGNMFDSIIFRHVLQYSEEATRIIYVSQYSPAGKLAGLLKRNPDNEIYFNSHKSLRDRISRVLSRISVAINNIDNNYAGSRYLHAKFMIFEMPDGQNIAITGSHNFIAVGATLGNREVALETTDEHVIASLQSFLDKYVRHTGSHAS